MKDFVRFLKFAGTRIVKGDANYYKWVGLLLLLISAGAACWLYQLRLGLGVTAMNDIVSWGAYIANFTYGVGLAAAAVMLVIPAYIYKNKPVKEVVFIGELMAIAAVAVCLLFIVVDLGRPDRFWHLVPRLGMFNFPYSILSWDVVVLNGYLVINLFISGYLLFTQFRGRRPKPIIYVPVIFVSMFWAVSLHTVTAFLYAGLGGRPYWNTAILAPRFLASAFVSGPAFIILVLRAVKKYLAFDVKEDVIRFLSRLLAVTTTVNLFLLGCEIFKEFYSHTVHINAARYLFFGLHGHHVLVAYIWSAVVLNVTACLILATRPLTEKRHLLEAACVMTIVGVWVEKGMGLIIPGFVPSPLGEVVDYSPSIIEFFVSLGIWSAGALVLTVLLRIAVPIEQMHLAHEAEHESHNAPVTVETVQGAHS